MTQYRRNASNLDGSATSHSHPICMQTFIFLHGPSLVFRPCESPGEGPFPFLSPPQFMHHLHSQTGARAQRAKSRHSLIPRRLPFVCRPYTQPSVPRLCAEEGANRGQREGPGPPTARARKAWHGNGRVTDAFYASLHTLLFVRKEGSADGTLAETRGVSKGLDAHARQRGRVVYALFSFIFMVFTMQITFYRTGNGKRGPVCGN